MGIMAASQIYFHGRIEMLYVIWVDVRADRVSDSADNLDDALDLWLRYSKLGLSPYIEIFHGDE